MSRQLRIAAENDLTPLERPAHVRRFVSMGLLVPLPGSADYRLDGVSFPVARRDVKTFVERLSRQYRAACGERLVVTSLTRPASRQPRNAHQRSVHRTGMAVDLRWSTRRTCQRWLETTLLALERQGVIEATRERHPAHYHVAVFPRRYASYVAGLNAGRRKPTPSRVPAPARREYAARTLTNPGGP
jgi:hypothetical protein